MQPLEIRRPDDPLTVLEVHASAYGGAPSELVVSAWRDALDLSSSNIGLIDGRIVACGTGTPARVALPGGASLPIMQTGNLAVEPGFQGRGIARKMMTHEFRGFRDDEVPAAMFSVTPAAARLHDSMGSGVALLGCEVDLAPTPHADKTEGRSWFGQVDLSELRARRETIAPGVPGSPLARREWEQAFRTVRNAQLGVDRVVHTDLGGDGGRSWALLRAEEETVIIDELCANVGDEVALVHAVAAVVVTKAIRVARCSFAAARTLAAAAPQAMVRHTTPAAWMRIIHVDRVLAARRYPIEGSLVLRVIDPLFAPDGETWQLDFSPDGAICGRSRKDPDVTLTIGCLASLLYGITHVGQARQSDLLSCTPTAARTLAYAFAPTLEAVCPVPI